MLSLDNRSRRCVLFFFFFQAEDGIRDLVRSRGLGDVYKRQDNDCAGDTGSRILKDWKVIFENGNNTYIRTTKSDGSYSAGLPEGNYTVSLVPKNNLYTICTCLLYTSPSPRYRTRSRMPSSA